VDDVELVKVGHCANQMLEEAAGFVFFEAGSPDDEIEELALFDVLHDEEEVPCGLYDFVELDDAGMADEFEDVDFPRDSLYVGHIDDLLLHQYLYCHPLASQHVRSHLHLPERSLPDGAAQLVVADALLLLVALAHAVITIIKRLILPLAMEIIASY
jgi:hypothetical protein